MNLWCVAGLAGCNRGRTTESGQQCWRPEEVALGRASLPSASPFRPVPACVPAPGRYVSLGLQHFVGTVFTGLLERSAGTLGSVSAGAVWAQGMLLPWTASGSFPPAFQAEHAGVVRKPETGLGLDNLAAFAAKLFSQKNGFWFTKTNKQKKGASRLKGGSSSEALL